MEAAGGRAGGSFLQWAVTGEAGMAEASICASVPPTML
jgi:hypothetical protein